MSLRKERIVNFVMALIVFCVGVQTFIMMIDQEEIQITEYSIDHPNETLEVGEEWIRVIDCSDWLEDHPELVEAVMIEREER